jgi:hypothetical protein
MDKENKAKQPTKTNELPSIKQARFTSHNKDNRGLSELDELLLENEDILQNAPKGKIQDAIADDVLADSFEFENSDDLNNIISKYENLLGAKPKVP